MEIADGMLQCIKFQTQEIQILKGSAVFGVITLL